MSVRSFVLDVARSLGRKDNEVQPLLQALKENWYDSLDSLAGSTADDLAAIGFPRRFAIDVVAALPRQKGGRKKGKGKGKDEGKDGAKGDRKGKGKDGKGRDGKGKDGKGKDKGKGQDKAGKGGKGKGGPQGGDVQQVIPLVLEGIDAVAFKLRKKILGNKGSNVHHIQDATGALLELKGKDEDGKMEMVVNGKDDKSVEQAAQMCEDLIQTMLDEAVDGPVAADDAGEAGEEGKKKNRKRGRKGKGKGGDAEDGEEDAETHEERVSVDAEAVPPEFKLRRALVGKGGCNVKHINTETGVKVFVEEDGTLVLKGSDADKIAAAKGMCEELIASILEEAANFDPEENTQAVAIATEAKPKKGKGKGKGKGKDKGDKGKGKGQGKKRKGGDDDGRPSKFAKKS